MGKAVIILMLGAFILALAFQIYSFSKKNNFLEEEIFVLEKELRSLISSQEKFKADLEYFSNPENLEKEIKGRFNYRGSDEKLIIIVPSRPSSTEIVQ